MASKTKIPRELRRLQAIEAGRQRRVARASQKEAQIEWFIDEVSDVINKTMKQRVRLATELVRSKVVINISRPVTKITSQSGRVIRVINRSVKGEFPKAETTQLMKTIFGDVVDMGNGITDGYIGTPLDYGFRLETSRALDRSFLKRTFYEERSKVIKILTGPITGISNPSSTIGHD